MNRQTYSLYPFQPLERGRIAVECEVVRKNGTIQLTYLLSGDLEEVDLPEASAKTIARRRDNLWEKTCFECFLQVENCPGYHEVNVSPEGDWNVYTFDQYRSGMRAEQRVTSLAIASDHLADNFVVEFSLPLDELDVSNSSLKLGLSTVLAHTDGNRSYWSFCHGGDRPDFHNDCCFLIAI